MRKRTKLSTIPVTTVVEKLNHEGRGIAHCDGKAVFLENALPGETVEFVYTKMHSRYAQGTVTKVIAASDQRIEPICEHFTLCGGCSLQHMNTDSQIELKQKTLLEQLNHFGKILPQNDEILLPLTGQTEGYRRKARLGVRFVGKKRTAIDRF